MGSVIECPDDPQPLSPYEARVQRIAQRADRLLRALDRHAAGQKALEPRRERRDLQDQPEGGGKGKLEAEIEEDHGVEREHEERCEDEAPTRGVQMTSPASTQTCIAY